MDSPRSFLPSQKTLKGILSGGITGGLEICITFPTEYVKTQLQLDARMGSNRRYTGIINCVSVTIRDHGIRGMYRGLSVLLAGSIPKSAYRFGTFEALKKRFVDEKGNLTPSKRLLCGMGAGAVEAVGAVTPMETLKVKFMNDQISPNPKFRGFFHGTREIIRTYGFFSLWQGLTPTLLKQASNQAIRFYVVLSLKDYYTGGNPSAHVPVLWVGLFGGIAGAASVLGNTPIDVIKTRLQGLDAHKYRNTWHCAVEIAKHEGIAGFYKGTLPRMSRVCLDVAITFMIYESIMSLLDKVWKTE